MNILAAIKREERKLERQLGKLQHQLDGKGKGSRTFDRSRIGQGEEEGIVRCR